MMHGRNNGKKLMAVRIVKHAMEIIHLLTDQNPIQVIVDAIINRYVLLQLSPETAAWIGCWNVDFYEDHTALFWRISNYWKTEISSLFAVDPVKTPPVSDLLELSGGKPSISPLWGGLTRLSTCLPLVPVSLLSETLRPLLSAWRTSWSTQLRVPPTGIASPQVYVLQNVIVM
jgi:hypothetical protein